jgi:regulator of RNase E activity RraB
MWREIMKLDYQFIVGDEVQVIGHSEWGNLTVVAVDVIYTVSDSDGLEDCYSEDQLKKIDKCEHEYGRWGTLNAPPRHGMMNLHYPYATMVNEYCPKCGEKL